MKRAEKAGCYAVAVTIDRSGGRNQETLFRMEHNARSGEPKILRRCTLPLTGVRCVQRIITDLCVFDVDRERGELVLVELAPGTTEGHIRERTEAAFRVAPEVRSIAV